MIARGAGRRRSAASSTRWSWVDEIGGVRFVNDSKATNIDAARQAIETFGRGLVVIMGGRFKGGDSRLLRPALAVAGRDGGGDWRSRAADARTRSRGGRRDARRPRWPTPCGRPWRRRGRGQRAAGAGVRQFRHVRRTTPRAAGPSRPRSPLCGAEMTGGEARRVSREQSSVGSARHGAGCWDPARPRAGSWCPCRGSD